MGTQYSPKIVTDGLVLCVDAANPKSYSGSGTSWNDISGNGSTATLINTPVWSQDVITSPRHIYFNFDATNDHVDFSISNFGSTNTVTIDMWLKIISESGGGGFLVSWDTYSTVYSAELGLGFNSDAADFFAADSSQINPFIDVWSNYVIEMRSDVSYTNNKIYINGNLLTLSEIYSGESAANRNFNGGSGHLLWSAIYNNDMLSQCSVVKMYNRALTPEEISYNFNALRGRHGI